jgi:2-amino-4-hydroxy-6-hydroxymethyldihydropteridine diphosphokinase
VLNAALQGATRLSPQALLDLCRSVEDEAGRRRGVPEWRTLDVDIILYDDLILDGPELTIPHPRFASRRFNLAPLAEIAPDRVHPVLRRSIRDLLEECEDPSWARVKVAGWGRRFVERTDRFR